MVGHRIVNFYKDIVQRKDDMNWVKRCTEYEVSGYVGRGHGRKTWKECVEKIEFGPVNGRQQ